MKFDFRVSLGTPSSHFIVEGRLIILVVCKKGMMAVVTENDDCEDATRRSGPKLNYPGPRKLEVCKPSAGEEEKTCTTTP